MPLDTRIPLAAVQPRRSLTEDFAQALQIKAAQQQMAAQEDAARVAGERRNALKGAIGPNGIDYEAAERIMLGLGDVEGAIGLRGQKLKESEAQTKAASAEIELRAKQIEDEGRLLSGVRDAQSLEAARQQAAARGYDVSDWPTEYNPQLIDQAVRATMDPKVRYEIAAKEADNKAKQADRDRKFGLDERRTAAAEMRARNSGPLAMVDMQSGTVTVGGPNGISPQGMRDAMTGRGVLKEAEAEGAAVGKFYGERFGQIMEGEKQARAEDANLARLDSLLSNVETGKFKGTTTELKKAAQAAGIDLAAVGITDDVAPVEAARALSNEMALQLRNPAGGAGMPGAMSDADRTFLQSMTPGIETTAEGRRLMIYTRKKINERRILEAREAAAYRRQHGRLDDGFTERMQSFADKNPLFQTPQDEREYARIKSGEWYLHPDGDVRMKP